MSDYKNPTRLYIGVSSDTASPEKIQDVLGLKADRVCTKGQPMPSGRSVYATNRAKFNYGEQLTLELERHISEFLERLIPQRDAFGILAEYCTITAVIVYFTRDGYPELTFSSELLEKLTFMKMGISIDMFGPAPHEIPLDEV